MKAVAEVGPFLHTYCIRVTLFRLYIFQHVIFLVSVAQKQTSPLRTKVTTEPEWLQASLDAHNFFRSLHGSSPLHLNKTLSEISQYYANQLLQVNLKKFDKQGKRREAIHFEHNPKLSGTGIGENLYFSTMFSVINPIPSPYPVLLWYEEFKDYDFIAAERRSTSNPKAPIGHLTQLLWNSTSQMGTAYASSKLPNNQTIVFVVANYFRQGNLILTGNEKKLYLENVLPSSRSVQDVNSAIVSRNVQYYDKHWSGEITSDTPESWRNAALKAHNFYRKLHGSQSLRINQDLCKVSQLWANHLLRKGFRDFEFHGVLHQLETNYVGVDFCNLGETSTRLISYEDSFSAENVVKSWYNQRKYYDFKENQRSKNVLYYTGTGEFERIIWNSTTEFCISYARKHASNGQYVTYITANYYPSVDVSDMQRNVFPSLANVRMTGYPFHSLVLLYTVVSILL